MLPHATVVNTSVWKERGWSSGHTEVEIVVNTRVFSSIFSFLFSSLSYVRVHAYILFNIYIYILRIISLVERA